MSGHYPDNWHDIRRAAYRRAGWRCEHCGMAFVPGTTKAVEARNRNGKPTILTVHHLDGNPAIASMKTCWSAARCAICIFKVFGSRAGCCPPIYRAINRGTWRHI